MHAWPHSKGSLDIEMPSSALQRLRGFGRLAQSGHWRLERVCSLFSSPRSLESRKNPEQTKEALHMLPENTPCPPPSPLAILWACLGSTEKKPLSHCPVHLHLTSLYVILSTWVWNLHEEPPILLVGKQRSSKVRECLTIQLNN